MTSVNQSLSNLDAIGIGRKGTINNPQFLSSPFWTVDTLFYITSDKKTDLNFLYFLTQTINWLKYDESSGVPSLSRKTINNIRIKAPLKNEQYKIGKLLKKLDNIITLEQEKLNLFETLKKALLQKIFPKKEEYIPSIRFQNFSTEWKSLKIKELGYIYTGNTPKTNNRKYYNSEGLPFVTPTDIENMKIIETEKKLTDFGYEVAKIVPKNTLLITSIASIGKNALTKEKVAFNQQINSLIPNISNDPYFLFIQSYFWSRYMKQIAPIGTMQIINKTTFSNLLTIIPTYQEQKKIGDLFRSLDNLIDNRQIKIIRYKKIKQLLLNNLFL